MREYEYLNDRYIKNRTKVDVISGLLMAQAICSRKLIESHDQRILDIMGTIADTIEDIKDNDD
jgi:hypothetical protein